MDWKPIIITNKKYKKSTTFQELADEWIKQKKNEVKESTYLKYLYNLHRYLMPVLQDVQLRELEKYDFKELMLDFNENYATKTVRLINVVLKSILYYAEENYDCHFKIKDIKTLKNEIEPLEILTKIEIGKLEKYCMEKNTLKSLGIVICLNTGLRIGEICALKWSDIDLNKKEIYVKKTVQRAYDISKNKTILLINKTKTQTSTRIIPISNKIIKILKEIKKENTPVSI